MNSGFIKRFGAFSSLHPAFASSVRKRFRAFPAAAALAASTLAFGLAACNVSDPDEHNEEELITTVLLAYTDTVSNLSDTVTFRDADGPGGLAPSAYDTIVLAPNRVYRVNLSLLDESHDDHAHDITAEVRDEGVDHQVFYAVAGANLVVAYRDQDANGLPLGLQTLQTTGAASTGTLTVTLKHQPGLKSASSTVATGETDVQIAFQVRVAAAGI